MNLDTTPRTTFKATCRLPKGRLSHRWTDSEAAHRRMRAGEAEKYGGRCAEEFTDRDEFEKHMTRLHGKRPWRPVPSAPYAHTAPKAPSEKVAAQRLAKFAEFLVEGDPR